jgi:hypothetical protein
LENEEEALEDLQSAFGSVMESLGDTVLVNR